MGVPVDGLVLLLGDNLSVVLSTMVPSSTLKKKYQAICYHCVRECVAANIIRFAHIDSIDNIADVLTKPLPNDLFFNLVRPCLFCQPHHIFDGKPKGDKISTNADNGSHSDGKLNSRIRPSLREIVPGQLLE